MPASRVRRADCMQTFASDTPAGNHVLIEGNHCETLEASQSGNTVSQLGF